MNNENTTAAHDLVAIKINNHAYSVTKGEHLVVDLKKLDGIPLADELEEIKNKKPEPLKDDGKTNVKGGEVFVSHPRGSGSSHE